MSEKEESPSLYLLAHADLHDRALRFPLFVELYCRSFQNMADEVNLEMWTVVDVKVAPEKNGQGKCHSDKKHLDH